MRKCLLPLLALCLILSLSAPAASALTLADAKDLLQNNYVDPIPPEILELDSLDKILQALDDPYTVYMTAEGYQQFLSGVNGDSVVGIGVSIQNAFDDGYQILSILPDSPALEAGLQPGDRIIAVDGVTLTADIDVRALIAGEEGTRVTVTIIRPSDNSRMDFPLKRRLVPIPIVTYKQSGNAGLISCDSFGADTFDVVYEGLTNLEDKAAIWIMDLRNNPGGTANAAAGTAGLFIGGAPMSYFLNSNGTGSALYSLATPDLTDKPLIVLTSSYSASGSELFAAAARDHGFGIALGQRTFGKGIAQIIFDESTHPDLFDGDCLKITTYRFYSPDGTTNHITGVLPTLLISPENSMTAAQLLSCPVSPYPENHVKLELAGHTFCIDLSQAVQPENVSAFTELLEALPPAALSFGDGGEWEPITAAALAEQLKLAITPRTFSDLADTPFQKEIQTLAAYQLLGGYPDGTFRPYGEITRAEFCAMVAAALNLSAGSAPLSFSDIESGAWYIPAVSAMAAEGFIAGYEDGTFRPDSPITYQEMVTILASVAAWANTECDALSQEALSIQDEADYMLFAPWAQSAARTLDRINALVGDQAPDDNGTRQVSAALLCTLMDRIHLLWD